MHPQRSLGERGAHKNKAANPKTELDRLRTPNNYLVRFALGKKACIFPRDRLNARVTTLKNIFTAFYVSLCLPLQANLIKIKDFRVRGHTPESQQI